MQPSILQRILLIFFLVGAVLLGIIVASGFLILALALVPLLLLRFWWHKKHVEKIIRQRQAARNKYQHAEQDASNPAHRSASGGTTIEGEVVRKSEPEQRETR